MVCLCVYMMSLFVLIRQWYVSLLCCVICSWTIICKIRRCMNQSCLGSYSVFNSGLNVMGIQLGLDCLNKVILYWKHSSCWRLKNSFQISSYSNILVICPIEFTMPVTTLYISFKNNSNTPAGLLYYFEIDFWMLSILYELLILL